MDAVHFMKKLLQTNDSNDVLALYAIIAYYTVFASIWMEYAKICYNYVACQVTVHSEAKMKMDPCNSCSKPLNRTMWAAELSI